MFKVLLCIPPVYEYNFPPLGTPALCGFLKAKGIVTEQVDLNIRYRDFLVEHIHSSSLSREEKKSLLEAILKRFFFEKLKNRYYSEFLPRDNCEATGFLPYNNNTNSSFHFTERLLSSDYLWRYLEDSSENTFYQFYEKEKFLNYLDKRKINLLGLSIISPSQVMPSLTLGFLMKKYLPQIHVCIGGQWPTLYRSALLAKKEFFRCFDSIIVFEGETPLHRLVMALKKKTDILIPNVILKDSETDFTQNHTEEDLNTLPCPDFDGLPLGSYDTLQKKKAINLTYETSRGCYWSKCAFCVDLPLPKPSYRRKHPDLVARDIKQLKKRYKAGHLIISDPGLSPRHMSEISKAILNNRLQISWWCWVRPDHGFNYQIFKQARCAGLKQINFGFESANDRICELLNKGNKKERSLRIIKESHQAGIETNLQTILGLPHETLDDALETIDFLITNKKIISSVAFNIYYLTPFNFIYQEPQKYGIEYENNPRLPFRFFTPFKNLYGLSQNKALQMERLYWALLKKDNKKKRRKIISLDETLSFSNTTSENCLEFILNKESCLINYLFNSKTGNYLFLDDKLKRIIYYIKEGLSLKAVHSSLSKAYPESELDSIFYSFIEDAIGRGFLVKKSKNP